MSLLGSDSLISSREFFHSQDKSRNSKPSTNQKRMARKRELTKGGFEIRLNAIWTARVTSTSMGGDSGFGRGGKRGLEMGGVG